MPRLPRLTALKLGLSVPTAPGIRRVESPAGGSTLITSAPMSQSSIEQNGPAMTWVRSSTRNPSSADVIASARQPSPRGAAAACGAAAATDPPRIRTATRRGLLVFGPSSSMQNSRLHPDRNDAIDPGHGVERIALRACETPHWPANRRLRLRLAPNQPSRSPRRSTGADSCQETRRNDPCLRLTPSTLSTAPSPPSPSTAPPPATP